ncbi:Glycosyl transferases group 1 [compost metagenome]
MEYFFAKNSHRIITPHSSRIDFYKDRIKNSAILKNHVVIENVPLYKLPATLPDVYPTPRRQGKITIGYFGTLDADTRGLEWLIAFANNNKSKIRLIIAGQGNLSTRIKEISTLSENVEFLGPFTHETLPHLYQEIDITWAYYSPKKELHRYAAPNKFYEHIYFKKPIIISRIIPQCSEIESIRTGIALDAEDFSVQNFDLSERKISARAVEV